MGHVIGKCLRAHGGGRNLWNSWPLVTKVLQLRNRKCTWGSLSITTHFRVKTLMWNFTSRVRSFLLSLSCMPHCCVRDISNSLVLTHLASGTACRQAPCIVAGAATCLYFRLIFKAFHTADDDGRWWHHHSCMAGKVNIWWALCPQLKGPEMYSDSNSDASSQILFSTFLSFTFHQAFFFQAW